LNENQTSVGGDTITEKSFEDNEEANSDEESEIVITSEQFRLKLKTIFTKLNDYLKKNKLPIREFLKGYIFRPTFEDPPIECNEDAIFLNSFVELLKTVNINMDTIDMYCVYTRLKIVDNSEAISVNYLEYELKNIEDGNAIGEANTSSNNFMMSNDTNSKSVDVKMDEGINEINKMQNPKNNMKISIDNQDNSLNNKKYKGEIALIESESEKGSLAEFEDSDSKSESSSSNDNKENCIKIINLYLKI